MRTQIWHIEVEYDWVTTRMVKGIQKKSKNITKGSFVTCAVGDTVEELNKSGYLMSCIASKIKTSQQVEVKITGWKWRKEMGMSNDVH